MHGGVKRGDGRLAVVANRVRRETISFRHLERFLAVLEIPLIATIRDSQVYVACAALRLARFNTNIAVVDKRFFQGLPSPAAGALIAGFVWLVVDNRLQVPREFLAWTSFVLTLYCGIAMVTNLPFYSGKSFALGRSVPFWVILVFVAGFVFISSDPPVVLFALFVIYGLSGWGVWLWRWRRQGQLSATRQQR